MRRLAVSAAVVLAVLAAASSAAGVESAELAVSPDGRFLYAGGGPTLTLGVDSATGALSLVDRRTPPSVLLAMPPDGRHLYGAWREGINVMSRDAQSGFLTHELTMTDGSLKNVSGLAASPDGHQVYALSGDSPQLITFNRDPQTGMLTRAGAIYGGPAPGEVPWLMGGFDIAVAPDGGALFVGLGGDMGVFRRDVTTGALEPQERVGASGAVEVAVSADGRRVYTGASEVTSFERDPATGTLTPLNRLTSPCEVYFCNEGWSIAPSPDGSLVFTTRQAERSLVQAAVVPAGLERRLDYVEGQDGAFGLVNPLELAWSSDGRFLFVGAFRNLWDDTRTNVTGLTTLTAYRRDPGQERLTPVNMVQPTFEPILGNDYSVTIEDGAKFTNSANVTLTVKAPRWAASLRLSNDGSFQGPAMRIAADGHYPWTLVDTGLGRDVRRVHVRFTQQGSTYGARDISDDIVLDQRPPVLVSARASRRSGAARATASRTRPRLLLRARDNRSGVRRVQITSRRARPGKARRFRRTLVLSRLPRRAWVRVLDGAGNRSRWRRIRER